MERIFERTLLFDFYGELLTKHQQRIYETVVLNDMGYSEVAQQEGISRQGVHELVRRCDKQLDEFEEKLHLVARFRLISENANKIRTIARQLEASAGTEAAREGLRQVVCCTNEILEEL